MYLSENLKVLSVLYQCSGALVHFCGSKLCSFSCSNPIMLAALSLYSQLHAFKCYILQLTRSLPILQLLCTIWKSCSSNRLFFSLDFHIMSLTFMDVKAFRSKRDNYKSTYTQHKLKRKKKSYPTRRKHIFVLAAWFAQSLRRWCRNLPNTGHIVAATQPQPCFGLTSNCMSKSSSKNVQDTRDTSPCWF